MLNKYDDFDIQIETAGEKYRVRLLNAPTGQATAEFALPFTDIELSNFLSRIGQVRRTMRRVDAPELQAAKEFGGKLFSAVFSGEMIAQLRGSIEQASDKEHGLRIRLRLTDVPALADLPWEFLYDASQNHFLTTSIETPVVRFLDLPQRITPLRVALPLRVLVMIASPRNLKRLDTEGEWERLQESLADLLGAGQIELERLPEATLDALRLRARGAPFHIFHFIGHGGFDDVVQDGVLQFEDEQSMSYPVRGESLGMLLRDHRSLRLAVLNACEGARSSRQDPFSGVAQSLLQQRVPAVIAMQFEISDAAAKVFAQEFYRAVAEGNPVDAAVCEARKALFKEEFGQEWATPVLYMRSQEGHLFELQAAAAAAAAVGAEEEQKRRLEEARRREAAARAEAERLAAEKAEAERAAAQKAEAERAAKLEKERRERERAEQERAAREKAEAEQQAAARAEAERQAALQAEEARKAKAAQERLGRQAAEKVRAERQREEAERRVREQAEFERLQREKAEAERAARARAEAERSASEQLPGDRKKEEGEGRRRQVWIALAAIALVVVAALVVRHYYPGNSKNPQMHYEMGESLQAQHNLQAAMTHYREAIRLKPDYVAAHAALGAALMENGDLENAIKELREAIRLDATDPVTHNELGLALFRKGNYENAINQYREALRLNPQNAETHYNLANALQSAGDREAATAEYRETLRLNPNFGATHSIPDLTGSEKQEILTAVATPENPKKNVPVMSPVGRISVGGNVQALKLVRRVEPQYPPLAVQAHVSGAVHLHAIIAPNGNVTEVDALSGNPLLVPSAMSAVKQWRYQPTLLNGRPVEVDTTIEVEYKLAGIATDSTSAPQASPTGSTGNSGSPDGTTSPAQTQAGNAPCTFGKIEFTEDGNRLIGKFPYTYQGNYPLGTVAIRAWAFDNNKQRLPGLQYAETTLQTASGTAYFSVESQPSLNQKTRESSYLLIAVVSKQTGNMVCSEVVPYQRKW